MCTVLSRLNRKNLVWSFCEQYKIIIKLKKKKKTIFHFVSFPDDLKELRLPRESIKKKKLIEVSKQTIIIGYVDSRWRTDLWSNFKGAEYYRTYRPTTRFKTTTGIKKKLDNNNNESWTKKAWPMFSHFGNSLNESNCATWKQPAANRRDCMLEPF